MARNESWVDGALFMMDGAMSLLAIAGLIGGVAAVGAVILL